MTYNLISAKKQVKTNTMNKIEVKSESQVSEDKKLMLVMQTGTKSEAEKALFTLRMRYNIPLYYFCCKILKYNKIIAEDMVQETFIKAWLGRGKYNSSESVVSTWLYHIAKNTVIDELRKNNIEVLNIDRLKVDVDSERSNSDTVSFQLEGNLISPLEKMVLAERKIAVLRAIDKVFTGSNGERDKRVLTLFYFEDLDLKEVSEQTNICVATVKIILMRAKEKLCQYLSRGNRV